MNNFIEVTISQNNEKLLVNVSDISAIAMYQPNNARIHYKSGDGESYITVYESYEEVKQLLRNTKGANEPNINKLKVQAVKEAIDIAMNTIGEHKDINDFLDEFTDVLEKHIAQLRKGE